MDRLDYSVINSTSYFCRGSGFGFQQLHGRSKLSIISVLRETMLFSGLYRYFMHVVHIHTCMHTKINIF